MLCEAAKLYGNGKVSFTTRLTVEVPGIHFDNIPAFKKLDIAMPGSTDVGDASYVAPTVMFMHSSYCKGTPGHSWQLTAQSKSAMMHDSMVHASKVMALTALKLLQDPALVEAAWKEHKDNGVVYECLMPNDLKPKLDRK